MRANHVFDVLTSPQKVSYHHLLESCPLSIFRESVPSTILPRNLCFIQVTSSFPQEWSNVPVQGTLQPRYCIYKDSDSNPDPATCDWVQLTYPLCGSHFSICKMRILMCTHLTARRKIFKIFSTVTGWKKYLLDENS